MEKHELLNHVGKDEFAFFVKKTADFRYKKNDSPNEFENWKIGKEYPSHPDACDMQNCIVVSVTKQQLNGFLDTWKNVYLSAECVYIPEGRSERFLEGFTIDNVNIALNSMPEAEKSNEQKLKEQLENQSAEMAELKQSLKEFKKQMTGVEEVEVKKPGRPSKK